MSRNALRHGVADVVDVNSVTTCPATVLGFLLPRVSWLSGAMAQLASAEQMGQ
ncbi:hypothetical protein JCM19237_4917 [Photobacterium aphoticum]|uniref:Uncharacterized protein n=1 Tax=Photobacterium aphoticum TaxID=754436 RepID=A0A090QVG2_9GAMM|nr:hypothetical protein JCM19237_4917 [Photobacterium aphoticum]